MPRELRTRKNRPSYANLFAALTDDDDAARGEDTPSEVTSNTKNPPRAESEASGSDFAPPSAGESPEEDLDEILDENDEDENENDSVASEVDGSVLEVNPRSGTDERSWPIALGGPTTTEVSKLKSLPAPSRNEAKQGLSTSRPSKASSAAVSSTLHRDRPWPAWIAPGRTIRLKRRPGLFEETTAELVRTTNSLLDERLAVRLAKAWSHDVGYGPVWELVEDRGWFKEGRIIEDTLAEADKNTDAMPDEGSNQDNHTVQCLQELRPRSYSGVVISTEINLLSKRDALKYLPGSDDGQAPPTIPCHFGPFGAQVRKEVNLFDVYRMSTFFEEGDSYVFHAGGPIWGIDWCPIFEEDAKVRSTCQYLAVAPFPSYEYSPAIGSRVARPFPSCIQLWSFGPGSGNNESLEGIDKVRCELVLCIESGPAYQLKWCPLPSNDPWSQNVSNSVSTRKLGVLGGVFGDGSLSFYAVPDPEDIRLGSDGQEPRFIHLKEPLLRIELEDASFWCFDWANSELVAAGCTNGNIALYHVKNGLLSGSTNLLPSLYMQVHQAAIRSISWIRIPPSDGKGKQHTDRDPTTLCTVSYDGSCVLVDTREQWPQEMFRSRDTINSVVFSPWCGGPITIEGEIAVKWYSMLPHVIGRGHGVLQTSGPVWALSASDYHPYLASASTDGSCCTTNVFKATRRRGKLPLFVHKIYQMDYNRKTKEWRMLEHFYPTEIAESRATKTINKTKKAKSGSQTQPTTNQVSEVGGSGAWPPEVGVHCVAWNTSNGLTKCQLLASGTASGLCRIDNLWGRFRKDHVPYGGIEVLRGETGVAVGEDEDSDDED
ncbi:hypothetical protein FRC03_010871 [Tulasnella sp. 419]|nr:hypothetical protein FRC03_010871 [Tulasnella sp. 419]